MVGNGDGESNSSSTEKRALLVNCIWGIFGCDILFVLSGGEEDLAFGSGTGSLTIPPW